MKPAARIHALEELMAKILAARIPMDGVTGDYFRHRSFIGSKDRADIADRIYTLARHYGRLNWWCAKLDIEADARHLVLLFLRLVEGKSAEDIAGFYTGEKYAPDALTSDEGRLLDDLADATLMPDDMPEGVQVECPPEHEVDLRALWGQQFSDEMTAMLRGAPLDLRVNGLRLTLAQAQASLKKDGVEATPTRFSPWGLRLSQKTFLSNTKAFREGFVDIQDEGSQLIALVCASRPGQQVLDYCAGAGGKTLALAGAMGNKGRIVAMDLEAGRLEKARPRFRRAGVHDIIEVRPLSDERHRKWLRRQKETFDVCLVDAPCGGSGTWRRNPDMRWWRFGPELAELLATQAEILDRVAGTVKPGGRLVYATCSLLRAENEDQVAAFLARHPEYRVMPLAAAWACPDRSVPCTGDFLRLSPAQHDTDGFFAAVLEKTS